MKRVGVIGAGPAGLTAAYELARRGVQVELFEAGPHAGGMCRTFDLWGHKVDLGPHRFFSRDVRVNRFWQEMAGADCKQVNRLTRIYFQGRFFDYPLRPLNAFKNMGLRNALLCGLSYLQKNPQAGTEPESFEEWVVRAFGRKLYEMFFKSYSEKLWGIPCDQLDADFAAQRIKQFSLGQALAGMLNLQRRGQATLVDRFLYPDQGTGVVYKQLLERLRQAGAVIHFSTPVAGLEDGGRRIRLADGSRHEFDHVVSTMPLTLLCRSLPGVPGPVLAACAALTYRTTLLVYLLVEGEDLFPDQWLYIHSPELRFGRVTNFANWSPGIRGPRGQTVLALEYWCYEGDDVHTMPSAELVRLAETEIRQTGLVGAAKILDGKVIRVDKCYPVYRKGYRADLALIMAHLKQAAPHVTAIGRYGAFKYNNQDHSILMGLLAAENLVDSAHHDLWDINTDYGTYQEQAA